MLPFASLCDVETGPQLSLIILVKLNFRKFSASDSFTTVCGGCEYFAYMCELEWAFPHIYSRFNWETFYTHLFLKTIPRSLRQKT